MIDGKTAIPTIRLDDEESRIWHTGSSEKLWAEIRRLALKIMDETGEATVTIRGTDGLPKRTVRRNDCLIYRDGDYVSP